MFDRVAAIFEVAADDLVARAGEVEGDGTGVVDGGGTVRAGEGEEALDTPDGPERIVGVERGGELADVRADGGGSGKAAAGAIPLAAGVCSPLRFDNAPAAAR